VTAAVLAVLLAAAPAPPPPPPSPPSPRVEVEVVPAPPPAPPAAPPAATEPSLPPLARPPPRAVEFHGEVRARGEVLRNLDLAPGIQTTPGLADNTAGSFLDGERVLLRSRFSAAGQPIERVTVFFQAQDARTFGEEASTVANAKNLDLHQGWFEVRDVFDAPVAVKVGRMELAYGDQRLIGNFGWDNVGRAFDGALARVRPYRQLAVDLFWTRLNEDPWAIGTAPFPPLGDDFGGAYASWTTERWVLDLYGLYLYDRGLRAEAPGDPAGVNRTRIDLWTVGARVDAKPVPGLHLNGEAAYQLGERATSAGAPAVDVAAWAVHAQADYTLPVRFAPKLVVGYDRATGNDDDPDTWETFENLFPTNHDKYGLMDLAAWKNLSDPFVGAAATHERFTLGATVHFLSRASADDTFYRANGTALVPLAAATTTDAKAVGTELDTTLTVQATSGVNVLLGYSTLFPGAFLDDVSGDGEAAQAHFTYLQVAAAF
jgi:hypothetical protein